MSVKKFDDSDVSDTVSNKGVIDYCMPIIVTTV